MPDFSLTGLIDDWVASREDKEFKSWRASQLGQCPRKHFLLRKGVRHTNPPDERSQRVFAAGDTFHNFVQDIALNSLQYETTGNKVFEKGAVLIEGELFDEELNLGGRYDLLIPQKEKTILYDIKSVHSRAFWNMEREKRDVYPHHKMQLAAYALMLKRAGTPVDEMRMFYISKDDLCCKEVTVPLTPELEKDVYNELALLNKHWAENTLPDCTCEGWQIQYCPFADPTSMKSVEKESKTGNKYTKRELTRCCGKDLYETSNH